jgi:hypothetical protein
MRHFNEFQKPFFEWLKEEFGNKEYILDLDGDVFDTRKQTNNNIINLSVEWFETLSNYFKEINIVIGNHDVISSHSDENKNIIQTLFRYSKNINVYNKITIKENHIYFPYDFRDTEEFNSIKKIKNKKDYILVGHFEIDKFYSTEWSLPSSFFKQWKYTFAGHYHEPTEIDNFRYAGTPLELIQPMKGKSVPRGVYVYDDEDFNPEFVEYPDYRHFYVYKIFDEESEKQSFEEATNLSGKHIKFYINKDYKTSSRKSLVKKLVKLEKNNKLKFETYDSEIIENEEDVESVSIFSEGEIKKAIFMFVDAKYSGTDIKDFKGYISNLLEEYKA